ncbi:MAG: AAA family ATPase [Timaviella obliquedivisa GSE-PSE-MK23-08B]|jgi:cellulose biosynthesis protein BcsQ|nr:AAA family ATPase [Timaviella obliquedivisa GSE-PSE-MK23-08B]
MFQPLPSFYDPENCRNESEVESKFIVQYLLPALGYPPETWHQEVTFENIRLDFLAIASTLFGWNGHLMVVIEAKHPKQNLSHHVRKFRRYLDELNVRYGLLTNGRQIRIYERTSEGLHLRLQILGQEVPQRIDELQALVGRQALQQKPLPSPSDFPISKQQEKQPMKTIAIYHNKGGVGKTTTVVNLAAALSKQKKRVLVIDLDSQANTTFATGLVKFQDELSDTIKSNYVYHVIVEKNKFPIHEVVRRSDFTTPPFDVLPSHIDFMEHEQELIQLPAALTRLVKKLKDVENSYDIVLIDTPPSLNLYARIALISADYLLIPSDLRPFANEGLRNVWRFVTDVNEFRESMGRSALEILGVLPSKISTAAKFVEYTLPKMEAIVSSQYGFSLLKSRIFERRDTSAAVEQSIEIGDLEIPNPTSILDYKPNSQAAEEFEELAQEVLSLIQS